MLRIDERRTTALLLYFCYGMQGERGFPGGLRPENFDDPPFRNAAAECEIERGRPGRELRNVTKGVLIHFHDGAFTVLLLYLGECGFDRFIFRIKFLGSFFGG